MRSEEMHQYCKSEKNISKELDVLYDDFDTRFKAGDFKGVDKFIRECKIEEAADYLILGILTASLSAKTKLPSRAEFLIRARAELKCRGEWIHGLFKGLE